ncbi:MAG: NAD(+) synthase [Bdellovibrionales bacterium]|nr:NAD(+) synthase [Bdellovibrionales bacterium]
MATEWGQFGFCRVSALLPKIELGKPLINADRILALLIRESKAGAQVVSAPELAITGYTCEDLFHSETLIRDSETAIKKIIDGSKGHLGLWVIGGPLRVQDGRLFNGAFVISDGKLLGFSPKIFLPNMGEFYERRWFVTGRTLHEGITHPVFGSFFASPHQVFSSGPMRVGVEICHDLWAPEAPSTSLALRGANLIVNLSASNELVGKARFRKKLVEVQSQKIHCAYLYSSCGTSESSKDTVFSGHSFAYELGKLIGESEPFSENADCFSVDFDFERILNSRTKDICFLEAVEHQEKKAMKVHEFLKNDVALQDLRRRVDAYPFLSEIPDFEDVLNIQAYGLLRRAESAGAKSLIVGVSGGLDSTLALKVAERARAFCENRLKLIGVTLPGPGTSEKTLNFARVLLDEIGVDQKIEVSITPAVNQHLKDLGKPESDRSVVYENAQARERTQILFDLANEHQGTVVGTGDLSELALGWCTFNADHMAHYAVNSGVPKTVVRALVQYLAEIAASRNLKSVLEKILDSPISPELLPPKADGEIAQETENLIGPYELHDFFLFGFLSGGFSKEKILALAKVAFENEPELSRQIERAHSVFFGRFFSQQFKRTTLPPGPKVHSVSLSPRSDFRLPDELKSL